MKALSDDKIIDSWSKNVEPWTQAIAQNEIESRILVTNDAIVDTVKTLNINKVLDVGCGEGWLTEALFNCGHQVIGIDAISGLIDKAKLYRKGQFQQISYEQITQDSFHTDFDGLVCNFSLLGEQSVEHLFQQAKNLLTPYGYIVLQTIHPVYGCGEQPYIDGWRKGSWTGFNNSFIDPAPWYFRTLSTWHSLFIKNDFTLNLIKEPIHPSSKKPVSLILVGKCLY